ncbi:MULTISPECIES: acetate--CoA ligase family protein [Polaromonas]|uniref:Acetate--CoA ligase family protein n=1 Tax=Polaromonas aquatica TaxID=332657 RepID=A0ABW1U7J2_9BURK
MSHRLSQLMEPQSIALIGASTNAGRIGGMPLELLQHFGYKGAVYPINPKYEEVFGNKCYPDIESLPAAPDLVVLAIAAADVTSMLKRCHAKGAGAAIVYASGFAEAGDEGAKLQEELRAFGEESGMLIAGPNCMGFANLNLNAFTAFASVFKAVPPQTEKGRVGIVTQSGNVCSAVFALIRRLGIPVSHFINTGNESNLEFSEYVQYLAQDPETSCVVSYVEQLRDGGRFIDAALEMAKEKKPLIIFKAGETEKGSEAVRSHTSALAGNLTLYKAAFEQLNVIRATDFAQMADLAYLSGFRNRKGGRRIGIVTISGALGAILADKMLGATLDVPTFSDELQRELGAGIPDYGMVSNPVDVTGNIVNSPEFVRTVFTALGTSPELDAVVVYAPGYLLDRMADEMAEASRKYGRLFVAIDTGSSKCREQLEAAGVPLFTDIGRFSQAFAPYSLWLDRQPGVARWAALRKQITAAPAKDLDDPLMNEFDTKRLLEGFGLVSVTEKFAPDAEHAVAAAEQIGYPVVLKILSADIAHKTEVGGVKLNIGDAGALRKACAEISESVTRLAPKARIDGFLVQAMATKGIAELIVGTTQDPIFGPSLTVGLGGVLTEIYKDASHRLLPIDSSMAREMLMELKSWPLLDGFRGRPKADVEAASKALTSLSSAGLAHRSQLQEIEINPLQVFAAGSGASALDALAIPTTLET